MRLIDADELIEHAWRDKLDSRELIAQMIENAPTYDGVIKITKELNEYREAFILASRGDLASAVNELPSPNQIGNGFGHT